MPDSAQPVELLTAAPFWLSRVRELSCSRRAPLLVSAVVAAILIVWLRLDHQIKAAYTPCLCFVSFILMTILAVILSRDAARQSRVPEEVEDSCLNFLEPIEHDDGSPTVVDELPEPEEWGTRRGAEGSREPVAIGGSSDGSGIHLPDSAQLNKRLEALLFHCQSNQKLGALILIHLDDFSNFTSMYGLNTAELLLDAIEARLLLCTRKQDFLSHVGQDQFAIAIPEIRWESDALGAANKVVAALSKPFILEGQTVEITSSAGIGLTCDGGQSTAEFIRCAEHGLKQARQKGPKSVHLFKPAAPTEIRERSTLERELHHALDREEFQLYYQPKVDLDKGRLVGLEALLRWNHPGLGVLPPGQFLQQAEECGFILPLTEWVLSQACLQVRTWQESGLPKLRVAVNLPERLFRERLVLPGILNALEDSGLDGEWLEIEVTERCALYDTEYTDAAMGAVRGMGVQVTIEKLSASLNAFAALKRLPFDTLKLDPIYIRNLSADVENAAAVKSIITLAKDLGRGILAEGVETERQLLGIRAHGCHQVQGFLISKPLPSNLIADLIRPTVPSGIPRYQRFDEPESLVEIIAQYSYVLPPKFELSNSESSPKCVIQPVR